MLFKQTIITRGRKFWSDTLRDSVAAEAMNVYRSNPRATAYQILTTAQNGIALQYRRKPKSILDSAVMLIALTKAGLRLVGDGTLARFEAIYPKPVATKRTRKASAVNTKPVAKTMPVAKSPIKKAVGNPIYTATKKATPKAAKAKGSTHVALGVDPLSRINRAITMVQGSNGELIQGNKTVATLYHQMTRAMVINDKTAAAGLADKILGLSTAPAKCPKVRSMAVA